LESSTDVGRDRPALASSDANAARFANDGNDATVWKPADGDQTPWWQVDLEGFYLVSATRVTFAAEGRHQYKIEISKDGKAWTTAIDQSRPRNAEKVRADTCSAGTIARYVRVTFPSGVLAPLADVKVFGSLWTQ
jgi:hyaluronoglucosaminidase